MLVHLPARQFLLSSFEAHGKLDIPYSSCKRLDCLDDLVKVGELEKLKPSWNEISGLLKKARRKLLDAKSDSISNETRLEQAYNVVLTCSIIGLRVKGYRIFKKASSHYIAIESLRQSLKLDESSIDYFQTLRGIRHRDIYEADVVIDIDDLNESIDEAEKLLITIESWVPHHFEH